MIILSLVDGHDEIYVNIPSAEIQRKRDTETETEKRERQKGTDRDRR